MIQTGDPTATGKGGQSIWGRPFSDEIRSTLKFNARGILAMANAGPDTNKSQFFVSSLDNNPLFCSMQSFKLDVKITYSKQPHLEGKYTIFGKYVKRFHRLQSRVLTIWKRVIDGADSTLDAMEKVPVNEKHRPLHEIRLKSVSIGYFDSCQY